MSLPATSIAGSPRRAPRCTNRAPSARCLLDQRVVAGLGNIWKTESLFRRADRSTNARARRADPRARSDLRDRARADADLRRGLEPGIFTRTRAPASHARAARPRSPRSSSVTHRVGRGLPTVPAASCGQSLAAPRLAAARSVTIAGDRGAKRNCAKPRRARAWYRRCCRCRSPKELHSWLPRSLSPPESFPHASEVSTTLSVGAGAAFEIFADIVEIPRWLPLRPDARACCRAQDDGRASRVGFTRRLERGSLGYTLEYTYDPYTYTITWATPRTSNVVLQGEARFVPLSSSACLMLYRLVMESADRRRPRSRASSMATQHLSSWRNSASTCAGSVRPHRDLHRLRVPRVALRWDRLSWRSGVHQKCAGSRDVRKDAPRFSRGATDARRAAFPHGTSKNARVRRRSSRSRKSSRELEDALGKLSRGADDALPADRARGDARAIWLRSAAPLARQVAAASRRDPRRRRAARADPDARSRGPRADRKGDRRARRSRAASCSSTSTCSICSTSS